MGSLGNFGMVVVLVVCPVGAFGTDADDELETFTLMENIMGELIGPLPDAPIASTAQP